MGELKMAVSRRDFVKKLGIAGVGLGAAVAGGSVLVQKLSDATRQVGTMSPKTPIGTSFAPEPVRGGTLDPTSIQKFARPLDRLGVMPAISSSDDLDYYEVALRQFDREIVPGLNTTVWGYGSVRHPESFSHPAWTFEAECNKPVRVKWINDLVKPNGEYLPPLLPVDQTLHWANPPGGVMGRDMKGTDPNPYRGPVPIVVHLHGAHSNPDSDGYPEAWFLPDATNIPAGYARVGSRYDEFKAEAEKNYGVDWEPGAAVFQYRNDQAAGMLWFHDHALGMTRANVYTGAAGAYFIRGGPGDLADDSVPKGAYEIPLIIKDSSFNADGSLFFPDNRAFFEGLEPDQLQIPLTPETTLSGEKSDIAPIWNPEFFGNTIVVNGKTWPYLEVERRRYRFRILNASDSRFFILKLSNGQTFWQIGSDGGFLARPAELDLLLIAPAERADIIIDFAKCAKGEKVILENIGPDEPFGGGVPGTDFDMSHAATSGQVMQFRVTRDATGKDKSVSPDKLKLPQPAELGASQYTRQLSLNELMSMTVFIPVDAAGTPVFDPMGNLNEVHGPEGPGVAAFGPAMAQLGTMEGGVPMPLPWAAPITEMPRSGRTEIWEFHNFTADAHPIHIHQIQFEVINREDIAGKVTGPEPWETGHKDTVIAYPGDEVTPAITRVKLKFDIPGIYVWHCHILSHEDNEMMRPFQVL